MSRFTKDKLHVVLIDNADGRAAIKGGRCTWRLTAPIAYDVGSVGSGETITVPAGATTDFASVPRFAWSIIPADGAWLKAAVVHDWLYRTRGTCQLDGEVYRTRPAPYTRAESDAIFKEAMGVLGVGSLTKAIIYAAVRVGGRNAFGT